MTASTLANRHFLITRPENQAERLATLLEDAGASALLAPMITITDTSLPAELEAVLARLGSYDIAVFISPTALDKVGAKLAQWPENLPAAVIGSGSRERAEQMGVKHIISPPLRFDSEGLLAEADLQEISGKRIVLFRGNGGREILADTLAARGASVDIVESYRRLPPTMELAQLENLLAGPCDGVIVTSSECVHNLFALAGSALSARLCSMLFFASHPRIADAARQHGVSRVLLTAAGDAGIVATLVECFAGAPLPTPAPETAIAPTVAEPPSVGEEAAMPPQEVVQSPVTPQPAPPAADMPDTPAQPPRRRVPRYMLWTLGAVAAAVGLSTLIMQRRMDEVRQEFQRNIAQAKVDTQALASNAQREENLAVQQRIDLIERHNDEIRAQQANLQSLYGTLSGDRETGLLADAELTLALSAQHLQLTGNISAALAALYRLDERLAGYDKSTLAALRRALARDIDALKRQPYVDLVGLSARLDSLSGGVEKLPLRVDAKSADGDEAALDSAASRADESWLRRISRDLGTALGAFVEIRRMDKPDPILLAPDQSLYLREHIKLRLLNARLALLQRDENTYRQDLIAAESELRRYFDIKSKPVAATLLAIKDLLAGRPALELPSLADSIAAARDARRAAEKGGQQ